MRVENPDHRNSVTPSGTGSATTLPMTDEEKALAPQKTRPLGFVPPAKKRPKR